MEKEVIHQIDLSTSIRYVKGIGEATSKLYDRLRIKTVYDLLDHLPRRYEDYSKVSRISDIKPGKVTIKAKIVQANGRYARKGLHITEAVASDDTSSVRLIWFNQPYRESSLKHGLEYYITGEFALKNQRLQISNPTMELVNDFPIHSARIVPVYRETKGLKSHSIRKAIKSLLPNLRQLPESLPDDVVKKYSLLSRADAVEQMHLPASVENLEIARYRLGFEEVFRLSLASYLNRQELSKEHSLIIPFDETTAKDFVSHLAFKLTNAQRRVVWQAYQDMTKPSPMNRLVEGDVGSGKTVVAAMTAVMAMTAGYQVVLMAPTEILARQHALSLSSLFAHTKYQNMVSLLVGSQTKKQKLVLKQKIKNGSIRLVVGTHALIEDDVELEKLGLIIVDEQHRFGVEQRKKLLVKANSIPHVLSLTATPIPRTLALTMFGEMDISILDEMPAGRKGIDTKVYDFKEYESSQKIVEQEMKNGQQIFVVCPLIVEDDEGSSRSVEKVYAEMKKRYSNYVIGLLHGKMKPSEKDQMMQDFKARKFDMLVSTTVIEVGVDVPNASVMMIESAERFGLAQLHQLRGRVGRGELKGHCLLITSPDIPVSKRLRMMESISDGFRLADIDLELRGPGAIYGTSQHGTLDLRVANLSDIDLIKSAKKAALDFMNSGPEMVKYPELNESVKNLRKITNLN